jgi:putative transposon-encoded protein
MHSAAEAARSGMERMHAAWDGSMKEINSMIKGIADHDSASQDTCTTQLTEYKKKLTKIHESSVSISIAVNSTSSEVSIYEKECKEKDEELHEIEVVHQKRVTKCTTERKVEKKTLETLKYDMRSMKKVAKAHIHLKSSGTKKKLYLLQQEEASRPRKSLADVRGMVKKTKETASKLQTCLAKSRIEKEKKNEVSLAEGNSEEAHSPIQCSGPAPKCFPVVCTPEGWACGEVNKCPLAQPRCHPVSCVDGVWKCGAITDNAFEACDGKHPGDACFYTKRNGRCIAQNIMRGVSLLDEDDEIDAKGDDDDDDDKDDSEDEEEEEDSDDDDDDEKDDRNNEVEVFLQEGEEVEGSPPLPPYGKPIIADAVLKCVVPDTPEECHEVVVELEHEFTESYVSLTRMIEEYEVVTHSTVCEETVEEEYTQESTAIQEEANQVCGEVQTTMSKLEQFKFEYQSTVKTEHKLETSIKLLVKQCGSLSSTEEYLSTVSTTLNALGDCPGLGEVQFQLPTWAGDWAKFKQKRNRSNKWNDKRMLKKCVKMFGKGARVAEVSEIDGQSIEGMPKKNNSPYAILGACPDCKGKPMPGITKNGYGRICWDAGSALSRKGRRRDCGGGPRSIMCVLDAKSGYNQGGGYGNQGGGYGR